jgi:hypothetical protein
MSPTSRPSLPRLALLAALGLPGCSLFDSDIDSATTGVDFTTTGTTSTSTTVDPPLTTTSTTVSTTAPTTTTTTSETTVTPTTGPEPGPEPVQRCNLVEAPDVLAAACGDAVECKIGSVHVMECDGATFYHQLVAAPGGNAVAYARTQGVPTFGYQHEVFLLSKDGAKAADIWVAHSSFDPPANLLPRADGEIELFYQDGQDGQVLHFLPHAEIDAEGYSIPATVRDDIAWFVGTELRPDDIPMAHFTRKDDTFLHALFDLPDGRVEQPLIDAGVDAWTMWLHDIGGTLKFTWVTYDQGKGGDTLHVRDLLADPSTPGDPFMLIADAFAPPVQDVTFSPFGDGTHAVVMTRLDLGEPVRLLANDPWKYDEELSGPGGACVKPTCAQGCGSVPACDDTWHEARAVALRNTADTVRAYHLDCPSDVTLTYEEDSYFDLFCLCNKCRCEGVLQNQVEKPCELVASDLAPDPNMPATLKRTELWRRSLGIHRTDLAIAAAVSGDTVWLLTRAEQPTKQLAIWRIDAG